MAEKLGIYKCEVCGNIVEVLHAGDGNLVCCGEPMKLLTAKTQAEEGKEKHVPVIEGKKVKIGSVPHPMEEKHYIEWIELSSDGVLCRRFLKPGIAPEAEFGKMTGELKAREYCNVHGLWKS